MSKPVFVTATERPAESEVIVGNDTLSVEKTNKLSVLEKAGMEKASGITISSDIELAKAKKEILKNNKSKNINGIGTDNNSIIKLDSVEDVDTLSKLQDELGLGIQAKDACPDLGFACGWFDTSALTKRIGIYKYRDQANNLMDKVLDLGSDSLFANIIRCSSYISAVGLKKFNEVADIVSGLGNTNFTEHIGSSISDLSDEVDPRTLLPNMDGNVSNSIATSNNLSVKKLISLFTSTKINTDVLVTKSKDLVNGGVKTTSTSSVSNMLSVDNKQNTTKDLMFNKTSTPPDMHKMAIISTVIDIDDEGVAIDKGAGAIPMTQGVVNSANNGNIPAAVLNNKELEIFNNTNQTPEQVVRNNVIGNSEDIVNNLMISKVAKDLINNGKIESLKQRYPNSDISSIISTMRKTKRFIMPNESIDKNSNNVRDYFLNEYKEIHTRVA